MFTFKIFELPDGKSNRQIELDENSLDLGEVSINSGKLDIEFEKTAHFIRVLLDIDVDVELICDRSLDSFSYQVEQTYEVLFKNDAEEEIGENGSIRKIDAQRNEINIAQDVLDSILVHLPAKKLHPRFLDENGKAKEFETKSFGKPEVEEETMDPRWAALKELKKK